MITVINVQGQRIQKLQFWDYWVGERNLFSVINVGGWGHGWCECPSLGNIDWRRLKGDPPAPANKEVPAISSSFGSHNPDPQIKLIDKRDEKYTDIGRSRNRVLLDYTTLQSLILSYITKEWGFKVKQMQITLDSETTRERDPELGGSSCGPGTLLIGVRWEWSSTSEMYL